MTKISNKAPRRDIHGEILDAHDGNLEFFGGLYWLYGTRYTNTNGYVKTNRYVCYSSPDLETWTPHGELIPELAPAVYYRPYVKFNARTGKYVLWFNWYAEWTGTTNWAAGDGPTPGRFGVATADAPQGPFHVVTMEVNLTRSVGVGDMNLFVDDDGTGYIVYAAPKQNFKLLVERLTDDFCASTMETSDVLAERVEAPALFKNGGFYYLLCGTLCCFGAEGSGAMVFRAKHPLGPYEYRNNINRAAPPPGLADDFNAGAATITAQQTDVSKIHTNTGTAYLWRGDRWDSTPDGIKGHDFQYWSEPLRFDNKGDLVPLRWTDEWAIELLSPVSPLALQGSDTTPFV